MNILKDLLLQAAFIAILIFTFQIFFAQRSQRKIILSVLLGLSILLCMSFPAYINSETRMDLRCIPLLLGTLYGGVRTGIFLSGLIIVYRFYLGIDLGFYTSTLTIIFSMPIILFLQKFFTASNKKNRLQITLLLAVVYNLVGLITFSMINGMFIEVVRLQLLLILINAAGVLFFVYLNEMIKEIAQRNQQLQAEAKDAEIAFLRSQINPHFLYNALNSIAALCIDEPQKAEEMTLDLSQYLRSSFDFKRLDTLTTIENELELVKAYINIEKARFGDRLDVEYHVDANLDIRIPPLILQPLVENAIRHGLMSNLRGGTVKISVKKQADAVVRFAVEDNGCGMSEKNREELLKQDADRKGVGLWNISRRIKLLYGSSIRIESKEGIGTMVFFDIPAPLNKQIGG